MMKKLNLAAMLLGAALFTGIGAVSASASDMKCGAGKCGGKKMEKPAKKCGAGKCGAQKKAMKSGKCGDAKKAKKAMKCGAGKCGSK
jgi:uncharacterized low-complexity protein